MKRKFLIAALVLMGLAQQVFPADVLEQVVIVTRHGVRAPTWTPEQLNQYSTAPWPDFGAPPGYLTPRGRALMKIMGGFYRELYSASVLQGAPNCGDVNRVYFWADTDQRTLETARAMAEGILPECKVEIHSKEPGASDPLFNAVEAGIAKPDPNLSLAAVRGRIGPKMEGLLDAYRPTFQLLERVLNGDGKAPKSIFDEPITVSQGKNNITMSGPLATASTFTENLLLEYTNGLGGDQFGWGRLNTTELEQLLALHTAYAELMRRTPYLAQARGSNLLSHIVRTMEQTAKGKTVKGAVGPKDSRLVVIVGHDTNISNLSGMLGLSWVLPSHQPDDAPPGGALVFSLWKSADGKYSVRTQIIAQTLEQMHNATPLSIQEPPVIANLFVPACSTAGDGYPCSWKDFTRTTKSVIVPAFVEK